MEVVGSDNFYSEFIKIMDNEEIKQLTALYNNIYDTGSIPPEWLKSTFITLPKQSNMKKCENYSIINLMSE